MKVVTLDPIVKVCRFCYDRLGKIVLWFGTTLTFLAIGGAGTVTYPSYTSYYYCAAIGLSLVVGGLLALI